MRWMAFETSSPMVSLAWGEDERCVREVSERGNASELVEELCRRLELDLASMRAIRHRSLWLAHW